MFSRYRSLGLVVIPDSCSCSNGDWRYFIETVERARFSRGRQVSTVHVDRGASNKECSSRQPEKAAWTRGRRTTDRNTCTGPYMGRHCERNRVPHERYILPSQPTAPFRDVAFHIVAVSPLVPIADRYRLTHARTRMPTLPRRLVQFVLRAASARLLSKKNSSKWNEFRAQIRVWIDYFNARVVRSFKTNR